MPLRKNQQIRLEIESLSSDGNGIGRHEGQVVFVPGAAVGDVLDVQIVKAAARYAYGRIVQVRAPGPGRAPEDCPAARQCGGCCFRHLDYTAELAAKSGFVADALRRIGGLSAPTEPILPSPAVNRYRSKVQFPVCAQGGMLRYGFYAPRSHRVVCCDDCLLQPEALNRIAAHAAEALQAAGVAAYNEQTHTGLVRHIYLREGANTGEVMLCLVLNGGALPNETGFARQAAAAFPQIKTVVLNQNAAATNVICGAKSRALYGDGTVESRLCGVPARLGVHSFAQVNTPAAEQLFATLRGWVRPEGKHILDLYCGTGVIGLSMAHAAQSLTGVETVPQAVESARHSAAEMGLANARFYCEDAEKAAARFAASGQNFDLAILDPPRAGAGDATLGALADMAPQSIAMVSCNPATLARDCAFLTRHGYALQRLRGADLFPRTRHVECLALLEKQ